MLFDGDGSESGGCNVLGQVQANRWAVCDVKTIGLRMAQVAPSIAVRECADGVCAEVACRCWFASAVESGTNVREWQREIVVVQLDVEESVRPCGPSSGIQGNEAARCELVLDGF